MPRSIFRLLARASITLMVLALAPFGASAAPQCAPRADAIERLYKRYKEIPVGIGVIHNGSLMEVFASEGGSTWSILVTSPQGWSCLVAAGEAWRHASPQAHFPPEL
jgi:hypothetical protein